MINNIDLAYSARQDELIRADAEERLEYRRQEALKGGFCPTCTMKGARLTSWRFALVRTYFCVECGARHSVTRADRQKSGRALWD